MVYANWTRQQPNETAPACLVALPDGSVDDVLCSKKFRALCVGGDGVPNHGMYFCVTKEWIPRDIFLLSGHKD